MPRFAALALAITTACTISPETTGQTTQAIIENDQCPPWDCGNNTAMLKGMEVDEVRLAGVPDPEDFTVLHLLYQGQKLKVRVVNGNLQGVNNLNMVVASGAGVVGSVLRLQRTADMKIYEIHIFGYDRVVTWTNPPFTLPMYHLGYFENASIPVDLCNDPPQPTPEWNGLETYALLVEGERYDREQKQVSAASGADWLNIACAGSGIAKTALMRYDHRVPLADNHATTPAQRTAALKMITADYCGTGKSFTEMHTPLRWHNQGDWVVSPHVTESSREALWTEDGALCLTRPRLAANEPDPVLVQTLYDAIEAECALAGKPMPPPCDDVIMVNGAPRAYGDWAMYSELRTLNP